MNDCRCPLRVGDIIETSYGTGPYRVDTAFGPCTCPEYTQSLEGHPLESELHWHFTCTDIRAQDAGRRDTERWLNGYREQNGRVVSVWNHDEIVVLEHGRPGVRQLELFA